MSLIFNIQNKSKSQIICREVWKHIIFWTLSRCEKAMAWVELLSWNQGISIHFSRAVVLSFNWKLCLVVKSYWGQSGDDMGMMCGWYAFDMRSVKSRENWPWTMLLRYEPEWHYWQNRIKSGSILSSDNTNCKNDIQ